MGHKDSEMVVEKSSFPTLAELEKRHILDALNLFKNNKTRAAKALGITTKTLYNKLHEYGMMGQGADDKAGKDGSAS